MDVPLKLKLLCQVNEGISVSILLLMDVPLKLEFIRVKGFSGIEFQSFF